MGTVYKGGIYAIDVAGVGTYYGESDNIQRRWTKHRKQLASGRHHCIKLRNAWKHLGPGKFTFRILAQSTELDASKTLRLAMEKALILADPNNLNTAGSVADKVTGTSLPNKDIYRNRIVYLKRIRATNYAQIRVTSKDGPILGVELVEGTFRMGLFQSDAKCKLTRINTRTKKSNGT